MQGNLAATKEKAYTIRVQALPVIMDCLFIANKKKKKEIILCFKILL